jgi:hypothetical protein
VAVRLLPSWGERPALWFSQAETQFSLISISISISISNERITFYCAIYQLDHRYAAELEDITSPPQQDPYTRLRTELLNRLSPSREQHARQLLTLQEMGDHKPSHFLRHLRRLAQRSSW